jgi:hypothetical protein
MIYCPAITSPPMIAEATLLLRNREKCVLFMNGAVARNVPDWN